MFARFMLVALCINPTSLVAQVTPGRIRQVTLYRDQALITREIDIAADEKDREINIGRLPENVIPDSVYAEGTSEIDIRSVRIIRQASTDSSRAEVRELTEKIAKLALDRERTTRNLQLLNKKMDYIDQLMEFSSNATQADIQRGLLNATALSELSNFSMGKQTELHESQLELESELAQISEQESLLKRQLDLFTQTSTTHHEVTLQIVSRGAQPGSIKLSYLVTGCGWEPQYTIRGTSGKATFDLQYSALVQQMSGEDWKDVDLSLSTASLAISTNGPALVPLRVNVASAKDAFPSPVATQLAKQSPALREPFQISETQSATRPSTRSDSDRDFELNNLANETQHFELQADSSQLKTLADDSNDDVASQVYHVEQTISLGSRREQQLVKVFDAELAGRFYHVATPLLSSFAYREADLINSLSTGLLHGAAMIYLDDRFVGRSRIPSVASGQHLIVGFGADPQIRTRRQLLEKSDDIQGGNRRLTFKYRLVVANFKNESVQLRLFDRLPFTGQSADVSVQLIPPQLPISIEGLYTRMQKPRGILRWDIEVPANRFGEKAFDVDYSYSTEFDRNLTLTALQSKEQLETDYIEVSTPSSGMGGGMGGMGGAMGGMNGGGK